ncbi:MAG: dTDP-glucose 4,6-dehydratase [Patescibacteria group bacterium]
MTDTGRTLLVTGGAGFIGSNFIQFWLDTFPQDTIRNLDALTYAGNLANLTDVADLPNYVFIEGNICDAATVERAMQDVDIVVHFAAESHVDRSITNPAIFLETNVLGTHQLLQSALAANVGHFHHISTDEVFGSLELDSQAQFSEDTKYDPRSPYAASKAAADHLVRAYGETFGLQYTITNCSNNYGPYHFPEKLIPLAITNAIDDQPLPLYGHGLFVRDWLYVEDHCRAIASVIEQGEKNTTYLVGGMDEEITNLDLLTLILSLMDKPDSLIKQVADRPGHDHKYSVDWSHINTTLGWSPSVTLEEGLQKTIRWYQDHQDWWRPLKEAQAEYFAKQYQVDRK